MVLKNVFGEQCTLMGKEPKVSFSESFKFQTHLSGGNYWYNYVDSGPGMETFVESTLSIKEFDPSLAAVINFSDPEAFKALVCPLGLEELRAIVRYEIINLNLLVIAVRHNQLLLDSSQRALAEVDLFEKGFLVAAPTSEIQNKLKEPSVLENNIRRLPEQERRNIKAKIRESISKCAYSVIAKKNRPRALVEKSFNKVRQAVIDHKFPKVEMGLRYLRSCRILLCHDYCTDIQSQIYLDSLRLELMSEVSQIRRRAYLLPRHAMVHSIPRSKYGESHYAAYCEPEPTEEQLTKEWLFFDPAIKQITDFWTLPDNWEITTLQADVERFQKVNGITKLYQLKASVDDDNPLRLPDVFSDNQKSLLLGHLPCVNRLSMHNFEKSFDQMGRYTNFKQAPIIEQ